MMKTLMKTHTIGRVLRFAFGVFVILSIAPFYLHGDVHFVSLAVLVSALLVIFYLALHFLIGKYFGGVPAWIGAMFAFAPLVVVYILGMGGGPVFGHGEGQMGVLTFLGVSLIVAAIRGDPGCEVMSIPNTLIGKRTHLACLFFSPLDRLEAKMRSTRRNQT